MLEFDLALTRYDGDGAEFWDNDGAETMTLTDEQWVQMGRPVDIHIVLTNPAI